MSRCIRDAVRAEVRAELGRRGMNGVQLARALGKSEMWVSRRLSGKTDFEVSELGEVAQVLKVPVADLLRRTA